MRVLDEGGNAWESRAKFESLAKALQELEKALDICRKRLPDSDLVFV